jgi:hypothetical protein
MGTRKVLHCSRSADTTVPGFAEGIGVYERLGKMVDAIGLLIISSSSVKSRFLTNVQQIKRKEYCPRKVL